MTLIRNILRGTAGLKRARAAAGFTLVEIAVVVVIISALLTMGIAALNAQLASAAVSATKKKQSTIQDALTTYLGLHGQLPCPDTDIFTNVPDGIENRQNGGSPAVQPITTLACATNFGVLPYVTLGLPQDMALDGWDNYFSYYVSNNAVANSDWTLTTTFHTGNLGAFNIYSTNSAINGGTPLALVAQRTGAVVAIASHGRNGFGAYTVQGTPNTGASTANDEYANTLSCKQAPGSGPACNLTDFYKRDTTDNTAATGGPFDDIVLFLEPGDLLTPLTKDGTMQGPVGTTRQTLSNLSDFIVAGTIANGGALPILPVTNDAWGNAISVQWGPTLAPNGHVTTTCIPTNAAYTLTSNGPDNIQGNADDVTQTVSVATVIKLMAGGGAVVSSGACGS
jgi:prepilin-type N-terminal cleavage/methylation domain-containing protein